MKTQLHYVQSVNEKALGFLFIYEVNIYQNLVADTTFPIFT